MDTIARPAIWSLGHRGGAVCDGRLPIVPAVSQGGWSETSRVLDVDAPLVWAWTSPGDRRAADRYAGRLIADVELRSWTGREVGDAAYLATRSVGVTSHGYVAPTLRGVLRPFAERGAVGVPQVYDTDRSLADPRGFLRRCLDSYAAAGFRRVVPLLGLSAGLERIEQWIDVCDEVGCPWHLYRLGRWDDAWAAALCPRLAASPTPSPRPSPPRPSPPRTSPTPWPRTSSAIPLLLLLGAVWAWRSRRALA